jgi:hypothetical protein
MSGAVLEISGQNDIDKLKEDLKFFTELRNHENEVFWKKVDVSLVIGGGLIVFYGVAIQQSIDKNIITVVSLMGFFLFAVLWVINRYDNLILGKLEKIINEYTNRIYQLKIFDYMGLESHIPKTNVRNVMGFYFAFVCAILGIITLGSHIGFATWNPGFNSTVTTLFLIAFFLMGLYIPCEEYFYFRKQNR